VPDEFEDYLVRISSFSPANCDGPFQRTAHLAHFAGLREGSGRDIGPEFAPQHPPVALRESQVNRSIVNFLRAHFSELFAMMFGPAFTAVLI
jgi:hypothetical protein